MAETMTTSVTRQLESGLVPGTSKQEDTSRIKTCEIEVLKLCSADCKVKPDEACGLTFVECGQCEKWFHFRCLSLPEGKCNSVRGLYYCRKCQKTLRDMRQLVLEDRGKDRRLEKLERLFVDFSADYKSLKNQLDLLAQVGNHSGRLANAVSGAGTSNSGHDFRCSPSKSLIGPEEKAQLLLSCEKLKKANEEMKNLILRERNNGIKAAALASQTTGTVGASVRHQPGKTRAAPQSKLMLQNTTPQSVVTRSSPQKTVSITKPEPETSNMKHTQSTGGLQRRLKRTLEDAIHPCSSMSQIARNEESPLEINSRLASSCGSSNSAHEPTSKKRIRFPKRNVPSRNYNESVLFDVVNAVPGEKAEEEEHEEEVNARFPKRNIAHKNYNLDEEEDDDEVALVGRSLIKTQSSNKETGSRASSSDGTLSKSKSSCKKYNVGDDDDDYDDTRVSSNRRRDNASGSSSGDGTESLISDYDSVDDEHDIVSAPLGEVAASENEELAGNFHENVIERELPNDIQLLVPKIEKQDINCDHSKHNDGSAASHNDVCLPNYHNASSTDPQVEDAAPKDGIRISVNGYMYCELCQKKYGGICQIHGPLTIVKDNSDLSCRKAHYADSTIPTGLFLAVQGGIWTKAETRFEKGVLFGPFVGLERERHLYGGCTFRHCWHLLETPSIKGRGRHVHGEDLSKSNWMRYVRRVERDNEEVANLVGFQTSDLIYYRGVKAIGPNEQLLVAIDESYQNALLAEESRPVAGTSTDESHADCPGPTGVVQPTPSAPYTTFLQCPHCDVNSTGIHHKEFLVHLAIHSNERPFPCSLCNLEFKMVSHLYKHSRKEHNVKPKVKCTMCSLWYEETHLLQQHQLENHVAPHNCGACDKTFFYKTSLEFHQVTCGHLGPSPRTIVIQDRNAASQSGMEVCAAVGGDFSKMLPLLTEMLQQPSAMKDVLKCTRENTPLVTIDDGNDVESAPSRDKLSNVGRYDAVLDIVLKSNRYQPIKVTTENIGERVTRNKIHHKDRPVYFGKATMTVQSQNIVPLCGKCSFLAANINECKDHLFNHFQAEHPCIPISNAEKIIYKCQECKYGTSFITHFKSHLLHHAQDRADLNTPTPCKSMSPVTDCRIMPVQCCQCNRKFATFALSERHRLRRHGNRQDLPFKIRNQFKCSLCRRRRFATKEQLTSHSRQYHHRENTGYSCAVCKKKFIYSQSKDYHVRRRHSDVADKLHVAGKTKCEIPIPTVDQKTGLSHILQDGNAPLTMEKLLPEGAPVADKYSEAEMPPSEPLTTDAPFSEPVGGTWQIQTFLASIVEQAVADISLNSRNGDVVPIDVGNGGSVPVPNEIVDEISATTCKSLPPIEQEPPVANKRSRYVKVKRAAKKKIFFCSKCRRGYTSEECRKKHETRVHLANPVHHCDACNARFCRRSGVKKHQSDQPTMSCTACKLEVTFSCHLKLHAGAMAVLYPSRPKVQTFGRKSGRSVSSADLKVSSAISSSTNVDIDLNLSGQASELVHLQQNGALRNVQETWPPEWNIPMESYEENAVFEDDDFVYCDDCDKKFLGGCPTHGPLVYIPDTDVADEEIQKGLTSLPKGFYVEESGIENAGQGVWANAKVAKGTVFGPYKGVITYENHESCQSDYCWHVVQKGKPSYCIDGKELSTSNWMRYINCANNEEQQNLTAFQYKGEIFYRTLKTVKPGDELLVWYGRDFAKILGLDPDSNESENESEVDLNNKKSKSSRSMDSDSRWEELLETLPYECSYCSYVFSDLQLFKHHLIEHTVLCSYEMHADGRQKLRCNYPNCNYMDNGNGYFKDHIFGHTGIRPYRCRKCKLSFKFKKSFVCHVTKHQNSAFFCRSMNRFRCELCSQMFSSKASLHLHKSENHAENKFAVCFGCQERFPDAVSAQNHQCGAFNVN